MGTNYKGVRKKFEQSVHDQTDLPARLAGIELFDALFSEIKTEENPDIYGIDLLLKDTKNPNIVLGAAEVEVKLVWTGKFRFNTLHFPERKEKFITGSTYFVIFNKALTECFVVEGQKILNSPKVEVSNYKIKNGEYFFDVPISECFHYKLSDLAKRAA